MKTPVPSPALPETEETPRSRRSSGQAGRHPKSSAAEDRSGTHGRVTDEGLNEIAAELARRLNRLVDTIEKLG